MSRFHIILQFSLIFAISCNTSVKEFDNKFLSPSHDSKALQDSILILSDARDTLGLKEILTSNDDYSLLYVAQAAASIQSALICEDLFKKLESPYVNVRRSIYFALGQCKNLENSQLLYSYLLREKDSVARIYLLEAIGKSGNKSLIHNLDTTTDFAEDAHGFALAYYRYSLRNIITDKCNDRMISFLSPEYTNETRQIASNFLARLRGKDLMEYVELLIETASNDPDPVVRMNVMTAFNKTNSQRIKKVLTATVGNQDEDYRVRVNAINSLNYYQYDDVAPLLIEILLDSNETLHVRLECADYFTNRLKKSEYNQLLKAANQLKYDIPLIEAKVLGSVLTHAKGSDSDLLTKYIQQRINETPTGLYRSMLVDAFGSQVTNFSLLPNYIFYDSSLVVNSAAMQSFFQLSQEEKFNELKKVSAKTNKELIHFFAENFKNAILSADATLIGYGAKGFRNEHVNYLEALENYDFILLAKQGLELPKDVETLIELEKTEAFIQNEAYKEVNPPVNNPIDLEQISAQKDIQSASIKTTKGDFSIQFNKNAAPGTVANFIELSQSGFYDNLFFHRVENNFVVQGGCPRGDGWGSSGKSIRSEFGHTYFKTGSVGMASAGKDTESCQWFVTHYPSSHLDGIYTNFADVTKGMEVVYNLAVGDSILSIELY